MRCALTGAAAVLFGVAVVVAFLGWTRPDAALVFMSVLSFCR